MKRLISIVFPVCVLAHAVQDQDKVNQSSLILKDFDLRVAAYVKLHKSVRSKIHGLKPTKTPKEIEHYEHSMAHGIREARRGSHQGNIFTPEISAQFRLLIGLAMRGPEAARIQESLKQAEPVQSRPIRANDSYPPGIPLQSTPPSLLLNLPKLPPELEYRLVGRSLILRDIEANLIVDFIVNALP